MSEKVEDSIGERRKNLEEYFLAHDPKLIRTLLDDWYKFPSGGMQRLYGYCTHHPRLPNGWVTTSPLRYFNREVGLAVTRNTIYILLKEAK